MKTCKNPECGKEIRDNLNYCNEQCLRRHLEIKKEEKEKKPAEQDSPETESFMKYVKRREAEKEAGTVKVSLENSHEDQRKTGNKNADISIEGVLTNPVYQRGASYRAEKLKAICNARKRGLTEEQIVKLLLRGGLTRQTTHTMMQDSREAYS